MDTGPVIERIFAKYAGIGWIGKNTCILNEQLGSWLFLGVMLTSLELAPDLPPPDRCGSCTRCLDACPTNAFPAPYQLDATKCISYLTIELRGSIPEELRPGIGRQVFGCDICQDVCPWNQSAPTTTIPEFEPRPALINPDLEWLAKLSVQEFREIFRGSPVKRAKLSGLRRNVTIAMANSGDERFLPILQQLSRDEDTIVAEHARWAIQRLIAPPQFLDKRLSSSQDSPTPIVAQTFPVRVGITFASPLWKRANPRQLTISRLARLLQYSRTRSEANEQGFNLRQQRNAGATAVSIQPDVIGGRQVSSPANRDGVLATPVLREARDSPFPLTRLMPTAPQLGRIRSPGHRGLPVSGREGFFLASIRFALLARQVASLPLTSIPFLAIKDSMTEALSRRLKQPQFSSPAQEALLSVIVAANTLNDLMDRICEEYGITRPQYNVLRILRGVHPEGHARNEIACRMLDRASDITRLVDRLQARGLVKRSRGDHDQRQAITCITAKGLRLLEKMRPQHRC